MLRGHESVVSNMLNVLIASDWKINLIENNRPSISLHGALPLSRFAVAVIDVVAQVKLYS